MQPIPARLPLCRCFAENPPALRGGDAHPTNGETAQYEVESSLILRPDVRCLQRWIDLNA